MSLAKPLSSPRGSYSSPRQQERQARILESARRLIAEKGYDGLTMRDLASASGVSEKTLYNLYRGKDQLIMRAVADLLDNIQQRVVESGCQPGLATILAYSAAMSEQIVETPAYADAMASGLFRANPDSPLVDVLMRSNGSLLERELRHALARGELHEDVDIGELASILVSHMWGTVLSWNKGLQALDGLPDLTRRSLCLCLSGVARGRGKQLVNCEAAATV